MYTVIKEFNGLKVGDTVDLNERRAKSELRNGNVKEEKGTYQTKEEKKVVKTKPGKVTKK